MRDYRAISMGHDTVGEGMSARYDVIVIGAGHNGLICGCLLAKAGMRTLVLERRDRVGGCTDTSAPWPDHPEWKVNTYSYVAGLMPRAVIRDADLGRHGLHVLPYDGYLVLQDDGRMLEFGHDPARTYDSIAQFSKKDAEAYPAWERWLGQLADAVWPLFTQVPPNLGSLRPSDLVATGRLAWQARRLGTRGVADLTRLFTLSAAEILDQWFESEQVKGGLAMMGTLGAYGGPAAPATAYVLLHLSMGDPGDGHVGGWGFVRGGMGGLAAACRRAAEAAGAEVRTGIGVSRILVEGGRVTGVALENGDELGAAVVVSSAHPKLTFLDLVGRDLLPPDFVATIERFRCRGGGVKINLALGELPAFSAFEGDASSRAEVAARPYHRCCFEMGPTPAYIQAAFDDAAAGRPATRPIADASFPSVCDDSLMADGTHCMSLYTQWVPDDWHGAPHRAELEAYADRVIDEYAAHAPGLKGAILARQVIGPYDMEHDLGLIGGNVYGGELSVDQMLHMRPAPGYADYRTPIRGLYNGSAGAHGGGGVSGIPGWQAARQAIKDRRLRRLPIA
jgi:phytoene dehydrogenase-like protein